MALRAVKPESIQKRFKAFFYGPAKVGKTTAAIQFPKPYLIDTEKGAENDKYVRLLQKSGGVVFQTNDFDELIEEILALMTTKHDYKTFIIDPLTTVYNDLLEKSAKLVGTEFGRHHGAANQQMKHLMNLLVRLDMNVIITSHAKNEYGKDLAVLGQTFDCYKKLDYLFDLILELQKRGKERVAIVKGTRLDGFEESEVFPFNYAEIQKRYGADILERDAVVEQLATPEQLNKLYGLIEALNISEEIQQKWLDKAKSENFQEMPCSVIDKCIEFMKTKITGVAA